jgi:segregation and condensation protein A
MAYKVKLEIFEGPLDLLLYLIKKNEIDVCNIPIFEITEQYLEYLNLMQMLDLDIAGEFLVMAATLMHIKSRTLLPPEEQEELEEAEEDPRAELVQKLLEYQRFKQAAGRLENMEGKRAEMFGRMPSLIESDDEDDNELFEANLFDLISAFSKVLSGVSQQTFQEIIVDEFSVEEQMNRILEHFQMRSQAYFRQLFGNMMNKLELVCTFLAILELIREKKLMVRQPELFGEILLIKAENN